MNSLLPTQRPYLPGKLQAAGLLAAGLAATMLYVQAKQRRAERNNPPEGQFIEVDGVRLHYLERGSGPPVVLLHGNGLFASDFTLSGVLDAAAPYRMIAFDRPGFGYSTRPGNTTWTPQAQARLLCHALRALGVEQPIVVGHSWGTLVALAMALDDPHAVRALALVSGYYYPSARPDVLLLSPPAIPGLGHLLRYTVAPLIGRAMWPRLVKRMFDPAPVPERFRALPAWLALRPAQLGAAAAETAMMVPAAKALSKRYHELAMPVALVAGTGDKVADIDHNAVRFHEEVAHSELHVEQGQGHMPHYASPERLLGLIAHLDKLAPTAPSRRH